MQYYLLSTPIIALGLCLILAVLVLQRNYRSSSHRLFSIFLFSMALWAGFIFGMRASPDAGYALIWDRAVMPVFVLAGVAFLHFSFLRARIKPKRWLLPGIYLFLLVCIALGPTDLIIKGIGEDAYGYFPISGPLFYFAPLSFYVFVILALNNFIKGYKVSTSYEERNSYLYIIAGIGAVSLGGVAELFSIFVMPIPPLALVGNIIFCILASIALLKYHLLDVRLVIRKGVTYFLFSALVALPYVGLILLFHNLLERAVPFWAHLILLVLLALSLQPLWNRMQRWVDRMFFRERYDFLKELEQFSQEVHDISDLEQLGSSLVQLSSRALQASGVCLLLHSESGDFTVVSSTGKNTAQFTVKSHSPLLRWLQSNKGLLHRQDLDSIPQLQALTGKDRNRLNEIRAELFIPMKTKQEELVGLIVLSEKLSQQPYSQEEEQLALTVATQVATELQNARLYTQEIAMHKKLQSQNEQKTEFLHGVAHELRTPLTAILSSSELLSEGSSIATDLRERLANNIRQSALSMDRRVSELLNLARLQIGELKIEPEPLAIKQTIAEVAQQLQIIFENKKQTLRLEIASSLPKVKADRRKLEQVLFNLLSNANKFSPTGSEITVRARKVNSKIIVEVEDSALAVTEAEKTKLFDPYYRSQDAEKRERFPGLGLGLAIAKKILELHQGEIWVENKQTKGNIFAFSLPILKRKLNRVG